MLTWGGEVQQSKQDISNIYTRIYNSDIVEDVNGQRIILDDALKDCNFKDCKIYGWSKQEATTGAQLFPTITPSTEEKNGITVEYMEQGKIHISGTAEQTEDFMTPTFELSAGTYTLSMGVNIDSALIRCTLSTIEGVPICDIRNNSSISETIEERKKLYLLLRVYSGKTVDIMIQPMLNVGTSPLPWEPYTGGQPSPSPDYPQEIVSAGAGGEINVEVHGKNLLNLQDAALYNCYIDKNGRIHSSINNHYYAFISLTYLNDMILKNKGKQLSFSVVGNPANKHVSIVIYGEFSNGSTFMEKSTIGDSVTLTIPEELESINRLELRFNRANVSFSDSDTTVKNLILSLGQAFYQPYYSPQSLSISTPTGLPAIPVNSGGNYTDANGQQWIADYIDLKRGKYVQNIRSIIIDGDSVKFKADATDTYWNLPVNSAPGVIPDKGNTGSSLYSVYPNNYFSREMILGQGKYQFLFTKKSIMKKYFASADDLTKFCAEKYAEGNPLKVYYVAYPIERDLTTAEIEAYQNLVTYGGTTIVENDADCYMELGYAADPKAYIDKKFAELSAAIVASASEAE